MTINRRRSWHSSSSLSSSFLVSTCILGGLLICLSLSMDVSQVRGPEPFDVLPAPPLWGTPALHPHFADEDALRTGEDNGNPLKVKTRLLREQDASLDEIQVRVKRKLPVASLLSRQSPQARMRGGGSSSSTKKVEPSFSSFLAKNLFAAGRGTVHAILFGLDYARAIRRKQGIMFLKERLLANEKVKAVAKALEADSIRDSVWAYYIRNGRRTDDFVLLEYMFSPHEWIVEAATLWLQKKPQLQKLWSTSSKPGWFVRDDRTKMDIVKSEVERQASWVLTEERVSIMGTMAVRLIDQVLKDYTSKKIAEETAQSRIKVALNTVEEEVSWLFGHADHYNLDDIAKEILARHQEPKAVGDKLTHFYQLFGKRIRNAAKETSFLEKAWSHVGWTVGGSGGHLRRGEDDALSKLLDARLEKIDKE